MKFLPISYYKPQNIVTQAAVDDDIFDVISTVPWYVTTINLPRPPRTAIVSGGKRFVVYLHRLVFFIRRNGLISPLTKEKLSEIAPLIGALPPVIFKDGNPFNCQLSNIDLRCGHNLTVAFQEKTIPSTVEEEEPIDSPSATASLIAGLREKANGLEQQFKKEKS